MWGYCELGIISLHIYQHYFIWKFFKQVSLFSWNDLTLLRGFLSFLGNEILETERITEWLVKMCFFFFCSGGESWNFCVFSWWCQQIFKKGRGECTSGFEWLPQIERSYHSLSILEDDVSFKGKRKESQIWESKISTHLWFCMMTLGLWHDKLWPICSVN